MADNYNTDFYNDGSFFPLFPDPALSEIDWSSHAVNGTNKFSTAPTPTPPPDPSSFITDTPMALPTTQGYSRMPPQEPHARPQHQPIGNINNSTSPVIPGFGHPIPPEFSAREMKLNGLKSSQLDPRLELPSHIALYTTIVARQDLSKYEKHFFPYLWFSEGPPHLMEGNDYENVILPESVGAITKALKSLEWNVGTLAMTAGHQLVFFFRHGNIKDILDTLTEKLGPDFSQGAILQGIPVENDILVFTAQVNSSLRTQHPQPMTIRPHPNVTRSHRPWIHLHGASGQSSSSESAVANSRCKKRNVPPIIFVDDETVTEKWSCKAPLPGIPNIKRYRYPPPPAVSGHSVGYQRFSEISTPDSYPHRKQRCPLRGPTKAQGRKSGSSKAPDKHPPNTTATSQTSEVANMDNFWGYNLRSSSSNPARPADQPVLRNIVTGYEGIATTGQSPDQAVNVDATDWARLTKPFAATTYELPQASWFDVPVYPQMQYDDGQNDQDIFGGGRVASFQSDHEQLELEPSPMIAWDSNEEFDELIRSAVLQMGTSPR